jgi:hypothetical protein
LVHITNITAQPPNKANPNTDKPASLVKNEIITAQDMRAFIPQEVLNSNQRIKFHNTPVSEVIMAILRKAD